MGGGLGAAYEMTDLIHWWSIDELIYCKSSAVLLSWGIDTIKGAATISWTITLWSFKCAQKWLSQSSPPCSSLHLQALAQQRLSNSKRQAEIRKKEKKKRKQQRGTDWDRTRREEKINSWHKVDCTYCTLSGGRQPRLASCQVLRTTSTETDRRADRQAESERQSGKQRGGRRRQQQQQCLKCSTSTTRCASQKASPLSCFISLIFCLLWSELKDDGGSGGGGGGGRVEGLRLRVLGLCKVSSLQRNTTKKKKIQTWCQTEKKPWKSNGGGGGVGEKKETEKVQKIKKDNKNYQRSFASALSLP